MNKIVVRGLGTAGMLLAALAVIGEKAHAQKKPIQISLVTPVQIFSERDTIAGLRLNVIYGRNAAMTGLDIGIANHTTVGPVKGWQIGIVGLAESGFMGVQDNYINITRERFEGLQIGFVNLVQEAGGMQYGLVNHVEDEMRGFQAGAVNYARHMGGLQLSVVNYAQRLRGVQIGLINIIKHDGALPVFPVINWSFPEERW